MGTHMNDTATFERLRDIIADTLKVDKDKVHSRSVLYR